MAVERTMRIDLQLASGGSVSRRDRNRNGAAGGADACPDWTAESKAGHAAPLATFWVIVQPVAPAAMARIATNTITCFTVRQSLCEPVPGKNTA
jgi:hypothetical protein